LEISGPSRTSREGFFSALAQKSNRIDTGILVALFKHSGQESTKIFVFRRVLKIQNHK